MTDSGHSDRLAAQRQLGAALRALQHRSGRTLRELEKQVPVSDSSLSRYFRGDAVVPWAVVVEICRALDGDPNEFRGLWETASALSPERVAPPASAGEGDTPATAPVPLRQRLRRWAGRPRPRRRVIAVAISAAAVGACLAAYGVHVAADSTNANASRGAAGGGAPRGEPGKGRVVFHEAEKARIYQVTIRDAVGARSGKAIARMDYRDSFVEFTVVAASAGPRTMRVRYSNGSLDDAGGPSCASHGLMVNGVVANAVHYSYTGWENWRKTEPVTVVLREGRNTIRFARGDLFTELDGIELA
ncbi:helix-turn-helix domain-containing protein [Streptomyces sp. TRM68416]|uniref:helix-turn-helix domain-containing protein n=1 Tax=Streptomyces sp. TRM68416 TaxID=2758412 RepID=UPI001661BE61|nr:helix-turn-helix domain-containing protein [Streptomyces sp. TRM68416]MBD0839751.1 helix-turn-helix domain-containing protein [Streptomyces sp. TRM68416]